MLEAILFDLDDTLFPQRPYLYQGFRAAARHAVRRYPSLAGQETTIERAFVDAYERGTERLFNVVLQHHLTQSSAEEINDYVERELLLFYRIFPRELALYADVRPFWERLNNAGIAKGLLTHGHPANQLSKLFALGIYEDFSAVEITGHYSPDKWKPAPFLFLKLLERLGVSAEQALYIGDDLVKDGGALDAGIEFVCIDREARYDRGDHPSVAFIASLAELNDRI